MTIFALQPTDLPPKPKVLRNYRGVPSAEVDGGEDGRVGAETGHNNEPALVVVNNGMHESGELTRR